jgi:hypothetical protein
MMAYGYYPTLDDLAKIALRMANAWTSPDSFGSTVPEARVGDRPVSLCRR